VNGKFASFKSDGIISDLFFKRTLKSNLVQIMAKEFSFHKVQASGNDFVVVDNRRKEVKNPTSFTREICAIHTGVGADGVLLLEKSSKADFKMRIINSDGSEAEACGNGFRCISLYANKVLGLPSTFKFETLSGIIEARIRGKQVRVKMSEPEIYTTEAKLTIGGKSFQYGFVNTGVPHVVVFVPDLKKIDVAKWGAAIRFHKTFSPKGTNVNFVEVKSKKSIAVRTYERGVEQETQACGTGSTASAIMASIYHKALSPVKVHTTGGEILNITFTHRDDEVKNVYLEGEATIVFKGQLSATR
jgi:diaminopimelate epimerase